MPYKDSIIPFFKQSHSSNFISDLNLKEVSCNQSRNSPTKHDNDYSKTIGNESEDQLAIILGYYNGEDYISDQLESIFNQTHPLAQFRLCVGKPSGSIFDLKNLQLRTCESLDIASSPGIAVNTLSRPL